MAAVIYPTTLPNPSVSVVTPRERRALSDVSGGPQQARALQADYLGTQTANWSTLNATEAAAFDAWFNATLQRGGAWFASTWPAPQGWTALVRRFEGAPKWSHRAGGFWDVSASLEVRGRGLLPNDCITANLSDLSSFQLVSGNAALFTSIVTPYGAGMHIETQNTGTEARIKRVISRLAIESISVKFQVTGDNTDDAGRLEIQSSGGSGTALTFIPRREVAFDPTRRAMVGGASGSQVISAAALVIGDWYSLDIIVAGGLHAVLTHLASGVTQGTTLSTVTLGTDLVSFSFSADSAGATCPVTYTDLHIC